MPIGLYTRLCGQLLNINIVCISLVSRDSTELTSIGDCVHITLVFFFQSNYQGHITHSEMLLNDGDCKSVILPMKNMIWNMIWLYLNAKCLWKKSIYYLRDVAFQCGVFMSTVCCKRVFWVRVGLSSADQPDHYTYAHNIMHIYVYVVCKLLLALCAPCPESYDVYFIISNYAIIAGTAWYLWNVFVFQMVRISQRDANARRIGVYAVLNAGDLQFRVVIVNVSYLFDRNFPAYSLRFAAVFGKPF